MTDGIETVNPEFEPIHVPEGITVVLIIVPADERYGGVEETTRWAHLFAQRIKGVVVVPYTELDGAGYWTSSPRFKPRDAAPPAGK